MIHKYMYDGLLSTLVVDLLERYPHKETVAGVFSMLLSGNSTEEKYARLASKWCQAGNLTLSPSDILLLLQSYPQSRQSLISPLVRFYLDNLRSPPDSPLLALLNSNPDESWLVPLLRGGMLTDPPGRLLGLIRKTVKEVTSPSEFEDKLVFPYYVGILETQTFLKVLRSEGSLYQ
jgi:hypothetical protein